MNRKKAIILITGLEAMLLAMLFVLFSTGALKVMTFAALAVVIGVVASTVMMLAIRKLPPM